MESAQCVCLTSPCSCHQWPGAGRHVSLPYPPVSYHSFICPQGMAALPKTTTHACSRRAFFYSSQHPQRKSDVPNCPPTAIVLFMVAFEIVFFFSSSPVPPSIVKRISIEKKDHYLHQAGGIFNKKKKKRKRKSGLNTGNSRMQDEFPNLAKKHFHTLNMLRKCFPNCSKLM